MSETKLEAMLGPIVRRYGIERVERCLRQMDPTVQRSSHSRSPKREETPPGRGPMASTDTKSVRMAATEYADKMDVSSEKRSAVFALAHRFENKSFLPTYRDISDFCEMHGIDVPASRSRASAIPRVFKFIAAMDAADIQGILDRDMFSGPAQLGPISDAIRHRRRNEVVALSAATPTAASSFSTAEVEGVRRRP